MMIMKKIYLLQATTTPYRTELFNLMEEESNTTNIDLTILYYKKMMGDRDWSVDESQMHHKYKIYDCFEYFIKSYPFYFSYSLIRDLIKEPETEVILGVSWNDFIVMMIVTLKRLGILKNKLHFWTEANYMAGGMKKKNSLKDKMRNYVFNTIDGKLIIPGRVAELTVKEHWHLDTEIIYLPNTVNIDFKEVNAKTFSNHKINVLIVARLEENIKGILNFIKNIDPKDLSKCHIIIAGEGRDRILYEDYIKKHFLDNIQLLGNIDREELLEYYKGCNLFVIPSFSDSNPLSIIEALFAAKPMLVSDQCGNKFEAIEEGMNGYLMNPYDSKDIKDKFHTLINRENNFKNMGEKSYAIALENFEPKKIVKNFLSSL